MLRRLVTRVLTLDLHEKGCSSFASSNIVRQQGLRHSRMGNEVCSCSIVTVLAFRDHSLTYGSDMRAADPCARRSSKPRRSESELARSRQSQNPLGENLSAGRHRHRSGSAAARGGPREDRGRDPLVRETERNRVSRFQQACRRLRIDAAQQRRTSRRSPSWRSLAGSVCTPPARSRRGGTEKTLCSS